MFVEQFRFECVGLLWRVDDIQRVASVVVLWILHEERQQQLPSVAIRQRLEGLTQLRILL